MRIVLWIGNEPNQMALANKIHSRIKVAGIVTESREVKRKISFAKIFEKGIEKIFLSSIAKAWFGMRRFYEEKCPTLPDVPILDVENINKEEVFEFTSNLHADLIIVSGTRLIKNRLISLSPSIGILNLHTGLSPYIKGGPNCTNWCLATGQFHLIGNTIMWLDAGIDTGKIVSTEFTGLDGIKSLEQLHIKVMEHAHDLYLRSIEKVFNGKVIGVKQSDIGKGTTYFNRQWNLRQKINLVRNFRKLKKYIKPEELELNRNRIRIINL